MHLTYLNRIANNVALSACDDIAAIMLPILKKHRITIFNYYRIYCDGTMIRLSTNRAWAKNYFKKGYIKHRISLPTYVKKPVNFAIWLIDDCPQMLADAAINFDIANGITIAVNLIDSVEYFSFGTKLNNRSIINNFYMNHLDLLQNYCSYFKDVSKPLLRQAEQEKLFISHLMSDSRRNSSKQLQKNFLSLPKPLSKRQWDCACLLLQGMKYREIGAELQLSARTIETHVNYLKEKLKCRNRTELILKLAAIIEI